jgi:hypothetical protein
LPVSKLDSSSTGDRFETDATMARVTERKPLSRNGLREMNRVADKEVTRVPPRVLDLHKALRKNNLRRPQWRRRESNPANESPISLDDNDLHAEPTAVVAPGHRASDITSQCLSSKDMNDSPDDVQFVISSWQSLSLEVRRVICSIVEAAVVQ